MRGPIDAVTMSAYAEHVSSWQSERILVDGEDSSVEQ